MTQYKYQNVYYVMREKGSGERFVDFAASHH